MLAVIIPTFNAQSCLTSILPDLSDTRLVISDGGSTDLTLKLALASGAVIARGVNCLLYTSPSPRDLSTSRMPSSA